MATTYDHKAIESKWRERWERDRLFYAPSGKGETLLRSGELRKGNEMYLLFAFPYPSGEGLHVGHVESMTALDIMARYFRMRGKDVFFPIGWDAFGLPAENYAVKTGIPPSETTKQSVETFKRQIREAGMSFSWDHELSSAHPGYYRWTQWLFLKLYEKGLVYRGTAMVNWCPDCQTVLANEQVVNGLCERSDTPVVQREMEQWFVKITKYAEELLSGLEDVDWPAATEQQQRNWIGKSEGLKEKWVVKDMDITLETFTTWPHTTWGATFIIVAPEHPIIETLIKGTDREREVKQFCKEIIDKKARTRNQDFDKEGVFTGRYAVNPLTGWDMPIYVANFAVMDYGTGIVKACPAHDERDYVFAKKYNLPIKRVIDSGNKSQGEYYVGEGVMVNAGDFTGMPTEGAREKITGLAIQKGYGKKMTAYRLRDWLISRQRYWGAPIPIVYDPEGKAHGVKEEHLPWMLPTDVEFKPTGQSPLRDSKEFRERVEKLYGTGWTPEYDTMDTFVDSSWYFLRYPDPRNEKALFDVDKGKKWLPPDFYMIGPEHIVLHLLYSRFLTKFLKDEGVVSFGEPFPKMRHQGIIMGPDGKRMSKSRGNVINPDDIVGEYGADTLRVYEMFMGPIDVNKPWDVHGVAGARRFVERVYRRLSLRRAQGKSAGGLSKAGLATLHTTLKKVGEDIEALKFNTAIAAMMEMLNGVESEALSADEQRILVRMVAPFAPFIAEEAWENLGEKGSIHESAWPAYDEKLTQVGSVTVAVQVNGKLRSVLNMTVDEAGMESIVIERARADEKVAKWIEKARGTRREARGYKRVVFVPGRLINFVV